MNTRTFRDQVAGYLSAHPDQWVDGMTLAQIGGQYAWRSRISDCRVDLGMVIENRQRRQRVPCGQTIVISEYRYRPSSVPAQQEMF